LKINLRKIIKTSEKVTELPEKASYKTDQVKFYIANFKWPKKAQWKKFPKTLNKREKLAFGISLILFLISFSFIANSLYIANTFPVPAQGGEYIEGIIGAPRFINPIYSDYSDVDRDSVEILFSGLMKYTPEGQIVPDLAEKVESDKEGTEIKIFLREDIFWSDGERITADDVIFTIKIIQDPDYKSSLRTNWLGIKAEKTSDRIITFRLKKPFSAFTERLTLKIIPKHIWQDIPSQNFPMSLFNLKPVGSGPYQVESLGQGKEGFIESLTLKPNKFYHGKKPYISEVTFRFFKNGEDLLGAWQRGEIDGYSFGFTENISRLSQTIFPNQADFKTYNFSLPRYFATFFNLNPKSGSNILDEQKIREALNYGTDKNEMIERILEGKAQIVHSPILPEIYGFNPSKKYDFDLEKAKEILEEAGFKETAHGIRQRRVEKDPLFEFKDTLKLGSQGEEVIKLQECLANEELVGPGIYPSGKVTGYFGEETKQAVINYQEKYYQDILKPWGFESGTGIVARTTREKLNQDCVKSEVKFTPLSFTLATVEDSLLQETSKLLKEQWLKMGVDLKIETYSISDIEKEIIKPREYEILLFGKSLGIIPDPYPFWHSSQKKDPGLNLTGYESKEADALLEEARSDLDAKTRAQKLQDFQEILIADVPCVFLFSPDYLYFVSEKVENIQSEIIVDPSKRFLNIESWYIKTKRSWK